MSGTTRISWFSDSRILGFSSSPTAYLYRGRCGSIGCQTHPFITLSMAEIKPLVFRWGIISTGKIAACFVKVSRALVSYSNVYKTYGSSCVGPACRSQDVCVPDYPRILALILVPLIPVRRRDTDDVVHKVAAVGSRSVFKAQEFIDEYAGGNKAIKAYGTYDEVYADKVSDVWSPPYCE